MTRPQHILMRAARDRRVFMVEEPVEGDSPGMETEDVYPNVRVLRPRLPGGLNDQPRQDWLRALLDACLAENGVVPGTLWYNTPMALPWSSHVCAPLTVYDCMDELSLLAGAPPQIRLLERQLLSRADIVFTGGYSLYEAKCILHPNVYAMPGSVDVQHFGAAKQLDPDPDDHREIPHPRLGYHGVLDERLDLELIAAIARTRPDWHVVLAGPVSAIAPEALPQLPNIHYLGRRDYDALPACFAAWDVALVPFALNEATFFHSPTMTPEYLAAGRHVVATPMREVVRTWGNTGLVRIAHGAPQFMEAIEACLADTDATRTTRLQLIMTQHSWDGTWRLMREIMARTAARAA